MDEEELVDQAADIEPSDDELDNGPEADISPPDVDPDTGDDDPDTGDDDPYAAQAREYDQSDDDNLTTGAVKTPGFIPDAEADKFFGGQQAPAAPKFIPDTEADKFFGQKTPGFIPDTEADKFFGDPKPGADDDNQFRGYIPTALRKFAQGLLKIDIPLEKGLAFLMYGDEKNWLTTSAEGREKNVNEFANATPLRTTKAEDESITGRAAETVSQIAPLFLLGGGLGGMAAAGLQMGLSGVEAGHQRAKAAGADPSQQYQQGLAEGAIGVGVGAATMGAATLLKPFARSGPSMMNWAQTTLKEAAREGAVFGTAMEAQEYLGEQAAKTIYDPKAEYHFDMVRFLSGLVAGGAIGGTRGAFQRYNPTTPTTGDAPPPDMAAPEGTPGEQRQDAKGAPAVNNSAGEAHANVKPLKTAEVGDPQNVAASDKGNTGRWAKRQARREAGEEVPPESNTGVTVLDKGQVDPTFVEALAPLRRPEPATPEPTGEPPVAPQRSSDSVPPAEPNPPPSSWQQHNQQATIDAFGNTPKGRQVAALAKEGKTAGEIAKATGLTADEARTLRDHYGIEPAGPLMTPGGAAIPREKPLEPVEPNERPLPVVRSEDARPQYEPQPTPQHDTVIPHPEYLRAVDNPPLKEPPSLGSPRPEITSQRASEGSTGVPEAVTRPVTTARERETANLAEMPTVEPQALVEPAAAPPPEAPRKPRVLEDLSAPPREFTTLQGQREEAPLPLNKQGGKRPGAAFDPIATIHNEGEASLRAKLSELTHSQLKDMVADYGMDPGKFVSKRSPEKIIDHIAKLSSSRATKGDAFLDPNSSWSNRKEAPAPREDGAPEEYQLEPGQYPIKDASGRVIGGRKSETEARERTRVLATAGELMNGDRFPFDGQKFDPRKPADMKAYRDRAAAIVKAAKEEGWRDYFPKQKVEDSDYRQAPAEALFMKEMVMLAKERFNRESAAKTLERELDLRMGPEGVEAVRSQRRGDVRTVEYDDTKHSNIQSFRRATTAPVERDTTTAENDVGRVYSPTKRQAVPVKTAKSESLNSALGSADFGKFHRELANQLAAGQPDVRVHTVSDQQMVDIAKAAWGEDNTIKTWGMYDPLTQDIFVRPNAPPDTLIHEAVHANADRKLMTDPAARAEVQKLMDAVKGDERIAAIEGGYPLSDVREFLAHGMTHPEFQKALGELKIDPALAKELGLPEWRNATAFQAFVNAIKRILGLGDEHFSALEGVMKISEGLIKNRETPAQTKALNDFAEGKTHSWPPDIQSRRVEVEKAAETMDRDVNGYLKQVRGAKTISQWPTHTIAQHADKLGKEFGKQAHIVAEQMERGGARAHEITNEDSNTVETLVKLSQKDPARFAEFDDMMAKMGSAGIWADRPVNKQGFRLDPATKAWAEAQHPDLEAWVNRMTPEEKEAFAEYADLIDARQKALGTEGAKNILKKFARIADKDLQERIRDGTTTPEDNAKVDPDIQRLIKNAYDAADYKRPYVNAERGGSKWAVTGKHKVAPPEASLNSTGEVKGRSRPTYEFRRVEDAKKFQAANKDGGEARLSPAYWVDKDTGKRFSTDANGKEIHLDEKDPNVEKRWEVSVQDQHLEFLDTEHEAAAREKALHESGVMVEGSTNIQPKKYVPATGAEALASHVGFNVEKLLRNNDNYQRMTKSDQAAMRQVLNEAHIELLGSTRTHNARLRRQNVHGADTDIVQGLLNYSQRTAHALAKLEVTPAHDDAREVMEKMINDPKERALSGARRRVANELDRRSNSWKNDDYNLARSAYGPYIHRITGMSAVMRLLTPGFWIRNSTQIGTHGGTMLGAEYGQGPGWRELYKVGKQTGYGKLLKEGFKEMGRAFKGDDTPANLFSEFKSTLKTDFDREAADYAAATKTIDRDASMDMGDFLRNPKGVKLDIGRGESKVRDAVEKGLTYADKKLDWLQRMSRAPTAAIETWMRGTMFVAAARLEFKKNGGDKEAAFRKAKDLVDDAMVRYTRTDRPLWQRHPLAAIPLQFKTFGWTQYAIYGRSLGRMIKNADPADRHIALMTLGGLAASHVIVAGLMGLPTEPARMLLLGARAMGLTNKEWDDVDHYFRNLTTEALGAKAGTALAKGLPTLLNIDLSSGLGADNLLTGFSPRYATDRDFDQGMWAWAAKQMGGAPAGMIMDMFGGVREAMSGNPVKAFTKMVPVKLLSDVAKAGAGYAEGRVADRGRQLSEPYTATEAISKAMGLPVARESNEQARNAYWAMNTKRSRDERSKLVAAYVRAKTPEARQEARQAALAGGIKGDDLAKAVTAEKSLERRVVNGVVTTPRDKGEAQNLGRIYNTGN